MKQINFKGIKKKFHIINAVTIVIAVIIMVFTVSRVCFLNQKQNEIEKNFSKLESLIQNNNENIIIKYNDSVAIEDEVSISLSIISAGISVFAIFGGILSVINIVSYKDIYSAIDAANKVMESQKELLAARLIQDGRVYQLRDRPKYALDCYDQAISIVPESNIALIAEYESFLLYSDIFSSNDEDIDKTEQMGNALISKLESFNGYEKKLLMGDTYFSFGCVYGTYAVKLNKPQYLKKSIEYFDKAISCDGNNVDFHRNLALTYALNNDVEKCKKSLEIAKRFAKSEPLYSTLMESERLKLLFKPSIKHLSRKIKNMLKKKFEIDLMTD